MLIYNLGSAICEFVYVSVAYLSVCLVFVSETILCQWLTSLKPTGELVAFEAALVADGFCGPSELKLFSATNGQTMRMKPVLANLLMKRAELLPDDVDEWTDAILGRLIEAMELYLEAFVIVTHVIHVSHN